MGRAHAIQSSTINELVRDAENLKKDDLYDLHGITIDEKGAVFDEVSNKTFKNVNEWANSVVEEYEEEQEEEFFVNPKWED